MAGKVTKVETGYADDGILDTPEEERRIEKARQAEAKKSAFDILSATLQKPVELEPILIPIPSRPNLSLRFDVNIDSFKFGRWTERSIRKVGGKPMPDPRSLACMVIANQMRGILVHGEEAIKEDGSSVTFIGPDLCSMLGLPEGSDRTEIVRALIGSDGHILAISNRILDAAGYGDDVISEDDENPTT